MLENGEIQSSVWKFSIATQNFEEKNPMIVKRIGHSMCYIEKDGGTIFVIGGRVNDDIRTKICEKYIIKENKWVKLALLNEARARSALATIQSKYIFAFFGTSSQMTTITTIEKYDIDQDHWFKIEPLNLMHRIEYTCGSAVTISQDSILLFGGFYDSPYNNIIQNKSIYQFNIANSSFQYFGKTLPLDFVSTNSSTPVIENNTVYEAGGFLESIKPVKLCEFGNYILKIAKNSAEVASIISGGEVTAPVITQPKTEFHGNPNLIEQPKQQTMKPDPIKSETKDPK